ncbi:MAG TPA: YbjN domain-containing protein [Allosphingosinicella sp.]|nr:YbjN domain-containing protein [Allosphingosinicella sp.]
MRLVTGLVLSLAAASSAAVAQAPPPWNPAAPENRQVLPTFNYETVESVLTQIHAQFVRRGTPERPALDVTFPNRRRAAILFGNCERAGAACKAISIQALWNRPTGAAGARLPAAIQAFNQRYAFSRAYLLADGRPALQRYLTADYGFIRGNLAVNLLVFATQSERFAAEVIAPPR